MTYFKMVKEMFGMLFSILQDHDFSFILDLERLGVTGYC